MFYHVDRFWVTRISVDGELFEWSTTFVTAISSAELVYIFRYQSTIDIFVASKYSTRDLHLSSGLRVTASVSIFNHLSDHDPYDSTRQ